MTSNIVFDEKRWVEIIKRPDWYDEFNSFAEKAQLRKETKSQEDKDTRYKIRQFFEQALENDQVNIAKPAYNFDGERLPVDTIVIHHTSNNSRYRLSYLNAVHLLNIYVPAFAKGDHKNKGIWSGHYNNGKQVFWSYHWFMLMDGKFERLLSDDKIGWHAGNWGINRRSIAICLDNDYDDRNPSDKILRKLAGFIKENYPDIKPTGIIGHCEARSGTTCPGKSFISSWKPKLLKYLSDDS